MLIALIGNPKSSLYVITGGSVARRAGRLQGPGGGSSVVGDGGGSTGVVTTGGGVVTTGGGGGGGGDFVVLTGGAGGFVVGFLVGLDVVVVVVVVGWEMWLPDPPPVFPPPPTVTPTPTRLPVLRLMPLTPGVVVLVLDVGSAEPSVGITMPLSPVAAPAGDEVPSASC